MGIWCCTLASNSFSTVYPFSVVLLTSNLLIFNQLMTLKSLEEFKVHERKELDKFPVCCCMYIVAFLPSLLVNQAHGFSSFYLYWYLFDHSLPSAYILKSTLPGGTLPKPFVEQSSKKLTIHTFSWKVSFLFDVWVNHFHCILILLLKLPS